MFITFEGIDLSGKSTQAGLLYDFLRKKRKKAVLVREPGGTVISEKIRDILLDKNHFKMFPVTEFLLFSASRFQLTEEVISPYLKKGYFVICDRYYDSSTAYQGYGGSVDLRKISFINNAATGGVKPDLTFLIDIDIKTASARRQKSGKEHDRIEKKKRDYYLKVSEGFRKIARKESSRFRIIDGSLPAEEVHKLVLTQLKKFKRFNINPI